MCTCPGHTMRRMQRVISILIAILFAASTVSVVHGQTSTIQLLNLTYPSQRVTNPTAPVTFDVAFSDVPKGVILFAGIQDTEYRRFPLGMVTGASEACLPLGETSSIEPFCAWKLNETSGREHIEFQLQISNRARIYYLAAYAGLANSTKQVIPNSITYQRFIIRGGSILTLRVTVLDNVSVTIDGKQQPPGTISIDITPGVHAISVPNMTSIDDSTRLVFGGWDDASMQTNRTYDLETDTQIAAEYIKEYKLTLSPASANGAGWYYEGSIVEISISPQTSLGLLGVLGAKTHFEGWYENGQLKTKSYNATLQMNSPHTLTAEMTTDYTLPTMILIVAVAAVVVLMVAYRRKYHSTTKT